MLIKLHNFFFVSEMRLLGTDLVVRHKDLRHDLVEDLNIFATVIYTTRH